MAAQLPSADIHALLAALGTYSKLFHSSIHSPVSEAASQQQNAGQAPQQGAIPGYPPPPGVPQNPQGMYNLPQPTNTGSVDLSSIRPVNSGSVSIADALSKARNFAAEKGIAFDPRNPRGVYNRG
jgi:far upstream element-binding protein